MLKLTINGKKEHTLELDKSDPSKGTLDGIFFEWKLVKIKEGSYHAIRQNKSYNLELISLDKSTKTIKVKVNGNKYTLQAKDRYDELLQKLGIDSSAGQKIKELRSPMPGLILEIRAQEGTVAKKGDTLMVLEAMKMENILKSPGDVIVKKIIVKKGMAVEKNQVLIQFN